MKILVVCQHYWPEPYPLPDICEELVRRGHTVHVLTGVPNYPMGKIYPGYRWGKNRKQEHNGVSVKRTFTIGRRHNVLFRLLNYYSFCISSTLRAMRLREEYDVVLANQTSPVMMVSGGLAYAEKHGKKCLLYCMDLWPASLAAGGIGEESLIYRFFGRVSRRLYRRADAILITSRQFRLYFKEKLGISDKEVFYLPQYAPSRFGAAVPSAPKDTVDLMFAGNIGTAQNLETVLAAADILRDERCLRWHLVGDGSESEKLQAAAREKGLEQVIFHGRLPAEEMPRLYAMADAMLVTLTDDPFISLTLPGKVQTYMAAGKPIIAAADGAIPEIIGESGCGFCVPAGDAKGLADAVRTFLTSSDREKLGQNARRYYEENFSEAAFFGRLEELLRQYTA